MLGRKFQLGDDVTSQFSVMESLILVLVDKGLSGDIEAIKLMFKYVDEHQMQMPTDMTEDLDKATVSILQKAGVPLPEQVMSKINKIVDAEFEEIFD